MHTEGIISNPVSQDIRQKGHQSIRFMPDGFSIMVSDAGFRPVHLKQYTFEATVPAASHPQECARILKEEQLLIFGGETVLVVDTAPAIVVPDQLFDLSMTRDILGRAIELKETDAAESHHLRERNMHMLFPVSAELNELREQFEGGAKVIHSAECLVSLSDQVQASDHQRGFVLADVQQTSLVLLVIQEDGVKLLNRFALKDTSDFIYHTLNSMKQLDLDRESMPAYLSGIVHPEHELYGLLEKYIRHVKTTPYYLEELSRTRVLQFMILSEGSKCA